MILIKRIKGFADSFEYLAQSGFVLAQGPFGPVPLRLFLYGVGGLESSGKIGDDRARAVILAALSDKAPIRRRAIVALANYEGPDIEAALESASEDKDWQVRSAVTQLRDD